MDIQEIQEKFEDLLLANPDFDESLLEKGEEGCYSDSDIQHMYSMFEAGTEVREQWQASKAQAMPEGFVLVSQKDLLELTIAINAVDLATHTESKTNEVREMWQQVALKLMALGTTQEPNQTPQFNLDEFLIMEEKLKHKGGVITADLDRFIAYAESVLSQAKATKEQK